MSCSPHVKAPAPSSPPPCPSVASLTQLTVQDVPKLQGRRMVIEEGKKKKKDGVSVKEAHSLSTEQHLATT